MGSLLESSADKVAKTVSMEMGKPLAAARGEVMKTAGHFKYYAANGEKLLKPKSIICAAKEAYVEYQPTGPLLCTLLNECRCNALEFSCLASF
jgi:acyl-CoA reductase-like NAD-dependent aldehyde dehydrogenase